MAVRGTDRQLQKAWRTRPPRGRRVAQGGVAILIAAVVGVAGALALRSCNDEDEPAATMPPISLSIAVTTTTIPVTTTTIATFYEVQSGDTLFLIAERFETDMQSIIDLNRLTDPDRIQAGQKLQIPPPTVLAALPPEATNPPEDTSP